MGESELELFVPSFSCSCSGEVGDVRRDAPGEAEGVSGGLMTLPPEMEARRASCRERLRMTSDFMEMGRGEPCSLKLLFCGARHT